MADRLVRRVQLVEITTPGADTDLFPPITPKRGTQQLRVTISPAADTTVKISTGSITILALDGVTVGAEKGQVFDFDVFDDESRTYSIQTGSAVDVDYLIVSEKRSDI